MKGTSIYLVILFLGLVSNDRFSNFYIEGNHLNDSKILSLKDSLISPLEVLMDSTHKYEFGHRCYFGGLPPKGRVAVDLLIYEKEFEKLKKVFEGNNNVGKAYAIEALLELNLQEKVMLRASELERIRFLITSDEIIQRCDGCAAFSSSFKALFSEKRYRKLIKKWHKIGNR